MRLHTYFRSGTSHRLRIALNLKGLAYEQRQERYLALNPQGLVPLLEDSGTRVGQLLAIIKYLERTHPEPPHPRRVPGARAVRPGHAGQPARRGVTPSADRESGEPRLCQ